MSQVVAGDFLAVHDFTIEAINMPELRPEAIDLIVVDGESCRSCKFWRWVTVDLTLSQDEWFAYGRCCIGRPTPNSKKMLFDNIPEPVWPGTYSSDWCGEWQENLAPRANIHDKAWWDEFFSKLSVDAKVALIAADATNLSGLLLLPANSLDPTISNDIYVAFLEVYSAVIPGWKRQRV